jgi:hypothetical protein
MHVSVIALILFLLSTLASQAFASSNTVVTPFDESKLSFDLYIDGIPNRYSVMSVFGLAQQQISLQIKHQKNKELIVTTHQGVELIPVAVGEWQYTLPDESGFYTLQVRHIDTNELMKLNIFVLHDFSELDHTKTLSGYQVGEYPQKPLYNLDAYLPPKGFVRVTSDLLDIKVSPHFSLRQFLCKQKSEFPKFLVLNQKILFKLEEVLSAVNAHGIAANTFSVMSAYRTPVYNRTIGQGLYSRHQWGDAVDIFIDESPKDGLMDDINQDGLVNHADAAFLYKLIDTIDFNSSARDLIGGLGDYSANKVRGPFVHIDARGYPARWGNTAR